MNPLRIILTVSNHYGVNARGLVHPYPKGNFKDAKTMAIMLVQKYCNLQLSVLNRLFSITNKSTYYHLEKGNTWIFQGGKFRVNYLQIVEKINASNP